VSTYNLQEFAEHPDHYRTLAELVWGRETNTPWQRPSERKWLLVFITPWSDDDSWGWRRHGGGVSDEEAQALAATRKALAETLSQHDRYRVVRLGEMSNGLVAVQRIGKDATSLLQTRDQVIERLLDWFSGPSRTEVQNERNAHVAAVAQERLAEYPEPDAERLGLETFGKGDALRHSLRWVAGWLARDAAQEVAGADPVYSTPADLDGGYLDEDSGEVVVVERKQLHGGEWHVGQAMHLALADLSVVDGIRVEIAPEAADAEHLMSSEGAEYLSCRVQKHRDPTHTCDRQIARRTCHGKRVIAYSPDTEVVMF